MGRLFECEIRGSLSRIRKKEGEPLRRRRDGERRPRKNYVEHDEGENLFVSD
jgi:hypothetical protein